MPLGGGLTAGLLAGGGSLLGGIFGGSGQLPGVEHAILNQELQQIKQLFPQFLSDATGLQNFYQQYMQQGSPFLKNIQSAAAGQNAQQFNNEAGTVRGQLTGAGIGYGPSGTLGATLGGMSTAAAQNASGNYLQNLLQNENMKFQAAQGLSNVTNTIKPPTVGTTNLSTQSQPSGLGGAIQNAGNAITGGINWGQLFGNNSGGGSSSLPATSGIPGTTGFSL